MQKIIVCDTSCLILFRKIGELNLLKQVFGKVIITETVAVEFKKEITTWIQIRNPSTNMHLGLQGFLDPGEASAISLATEFKEALLLIDESKGRKIAKELGIAILGSLGVLVTAKNKGLIKSVKPILEKITNTNFRISDNLITKVVDSANEL